MNMNKRNKQRTVVVQPSPVGEASRQQYEAEKRTLMRQVESLEEANDQLNSTITMLTEACDAYDAEYHAASKKRAVSLNCAFWTAVVALCAGALITTYIPHVIAA